MKLIFSEIILLDQGWVRIERLEEVLVEILIQEAVFQGRQGMDPEVIESYEERSSKYVADLKFQVLKQIVKEQVPSKKV
jgi:hypothetical protein